MHESTERLLPPLLRPVDIEQLRNALAISAQKARRRVRPIDQCAEDNQYRITNPKEAYRRVLLTNPSGRGKSQSIVGQTGHLERANAWSHVVAAFAFGIFAMVRAAAFGTPNMAAQLTGVSLVVASWCFGLSTIYHVYVPVPGYGSLVRYLDHVGIYSAMATAGVADLAVVTLSFSHASPHTFLDPLIAATIMGGYFTVRRIYISEAESTRDFMPEACSIGLYRVFHYDLEHAGLRIAGVMSMALIWVYAVPAAYNNLTDDAANVWVVGRALSTALLVAGVIFDNTYAIEHDLAAGGNRCQCCASKELGCVVTSHTVWHLISFLATITLTAARQYAIQTMS